MKREIKFRAFDDGKMILQSEVQPVLLNPYDQLQYFFKSVRDDSIVMQYTGIKDKNGVDIYEGDILRHTSKNPDKPGIYHNVIEYFSGGTLCGFRMRNGRFHKPLRLNNIYGSEVIGNIYENQELLTPQPADHDTIHQ